MHRATAVPLNAGLRFLFRDKSLDTRRALARRVQLAGVFGTSAITPTNLLNMKTKNLGHNFLLGINLVTALNGLLADWNRTHLFNQRWTPHAKYHDAMTISVGLLLGGLGVYALKCKSGARSGNVRLAALCPAIFFGAMVAAQAFPGADTIETEFPDFWPKIGRFSFNEVPFALSMLAMTALAWRLTERSHDQAASRLPAEARAYLEAAAELRVS